MQNSILDVRHQQFEEVVSSHADLEVVADGFTFIEGPIWHPHNHDLTFSDIIGNTIFRWQSETGVSVVRQPSNMANGNTYDRQGRMLSCEHATSRVTRTATNGNIEVLATHYDGKELNSPNDIVVKSDGMVYFTDPASGRTAKFGLERPQDLSFQGVYRLDPETRELTLLVDDFEKPNGLCFSGDEKTLYVNDTARQHIRAFAVTSAGTLSKGR